MFRKIVAAINCENARKDTKKSAPNHYKYGNIIIKSY